VKDAGAAGARTAWTAGAQGQGSRPQAVSVTAATGLWTQDAVIFNAPGRRRSPVLRPRQGTCDEAAGSPMPRVHAPAGYGIGAALQITALVSGTGSILHDSPERSEVEFARAVLWVAGAALSSLLDGSAQRRAVAGRVEGQAVRPSAEHGRPEVRLICSQPPVSQLSARNNVESPTGRC